MVAEISGWLSSRGSDPTPAEPGAPDARQSRPRSAIARQAQRGRRSGAVRGNRADEGTDVSGLAEG
jgi:hypothetical protein